MPFNPRYEIDPSGRAIPAPNKPSPPAYVGLGLNTVVPSQQARTILDWRGEDNNATDMRLFCGANDGVLNPYDYINGSNVSGELIPARNAPNGDRSNIVKVTFGVGAVSNEFYMDANPGQSAVLPASFIRVEGINVSSGDLAFSAMITKSGGAGKNELYLTQRFGYTDAGLWQGINIPAYARSIRFTKWIDGVAPDQQVEIRDSTSLGIVVIPAGVDTFVHDLCGEGSQIFMRAAAAAIYELVWTLLI